ncbi:hypothetical protein [Vibrio harveyi]|uniref:hypothetical protein n=1 Tax=Vibrio harveyi TaxID=669 RepID=UPI003CEF56C0
MFQYKGLTIAPELTRYILQRDHEYECGYIRIAAFEYDFANANSEERKCLSGVGTCCTSYERDSKVYWIGHELELTHSSVSETEANAWLNDAAEGAVFYDELTYNILSDLSGTTRVFNDENRSVG